MKYFHNSTKMLPLLAIALACCSVCTLAQQVQSSLPAPNNLSFSPEDVNWDDQFYLCGVDGWVSAVAISPGGDVYVGGGFQYVADVLVSGVAKWDGISWDALNGGVEAFGNPATIEAIAIDGTDVYVGGGFDTAGGMPANGIARWDGISWSALGSGLEYGIRFGDVHSIIVSGGDLYVGGLFDTAGGVPVNNIARWDGAAWHALAAGLGGPVGVSSDVFALALGDSGLYVGGWFEHVIDGDGLPVYAPYIARWHENAWSTLGGGVDGQVWSLAIAGDSLYAAGEFSQGVSLWDCRSESWLPMGGGLSGDGYSVLVWGGGVVVGGRFTQAGGVSANNVARWDGWDWQALGDGLPMITSLPRVDAMASFGASLYVGGHFDLAGSTYTNSIARWNGVSWSSLDPSGVGKGMSDEVHAIAVAEDDVYVGGNFYRAGGLQANCIAKWNGATWDSLGGGVEGPISAIAASAGDVYVGGDFNTAGGMPAAGLARWDGSSWNPVGGVLDGVVYCLQAKDSDLYVGGALILPITPPFHFIARWDGSNWHGLGGGVDAPVYAIAVVGDDVYVGGNITNAAGMPANCIARWDGSNWWALGGGLTGGSAPCVYTLTAIGSNIYVGGAFSTAGENAASNIAMWDGADWYTLGDGVNGMVSASTTSSGELYIGGSFSMAGAIPVNGLAKWNATGWSPLGSGVGPPGVVFALAAMDRDIYTGGTFHMAGGRLSMHIGLYADPQVSGLVPSPAQISQVMLLDQNYPNPFNPQTTIAFVLPQRTAVSLCIFDVSGRLVRALISDEVHPPGRHETVWNGEDDFGRSVASAPYFYRLSAGGYMETKRMTLIK